MRLIEILAHRHRSSSVFVVVGLVLLAISILFATLARALNKLNLLTGQFLSEYLI